MTRSMNQKFKLIYLMKLLWEQTDETHVISMKQIIDNMDSRGIHAERKSIYDDMHVLRTIGWDIRYRRERPSGYYLKNHVFEDADMKILIVNGPNLNLLGRREPEIYGQDSMETLLGRLRAAYPDVELEYAQSNSEGVLIDHLQEAGYRCDGIVFNAGAYTHTSVALHDAIKAIPAPVVEIHISNVHTREAFRREYSQYQRMYLHMLLTRRYRHSSLLDREQRPLERREGAGAPSDDST